MRKTEFIDEKRRELAARHGVHESDVLTTAGAAKVLGKPVRSIIRERMTYPRYYRADEAVANSECLYLRADCESYVRPTGAALRVLRNAKNGKPPQKYEDLHGEKKWPTIASLPSPNLTADPPATSLMVRITRAVKIWKERELFRRASLYINDKGDNRDFADECIAMGIGLTKEELDAMPPDERKELSDILDRRLDVIFDKTNDMLREARVELEPESFQFHVASRFVEAAYTSILESELEWCCRRYDTMPTELPPEYE